MGDQTGPEGLWGVLLTHLGHSCREVAAVLKWTGREFLPLDLIASLECLDDWSSQGSGVVVRTQDAQKGLGLNQVPL